MKKRFTLERIYPSPIEKVWFALTDSKALAAWLMPNNFKLEQGHQFQFTTDPAPGFDGIVNCEVLAFEEPTWLKISWRGGPVNTVVSFQLETVPRGTKFTLVHDGFRGIKERLVGLMLKWGSDKMLTRLLPQVLASIDTTGYHPDQPPGKPEGCWTPRARWLVKLLGWLYRGKGVEAWRKKK